MSAYECRSFVVCRLEDDERETPLGTLWCEGWGDAIATARMLYVGPLLVRSSAESIEVSNRWLDAYDKEAKATHAENEAIRAMERRRQFEQKIMDVINWLYPNPNLRPD